MEEILKIIYYDYYNLIKKLQLTTDKEIMNFVYFLKDKNADIDLTILLDEFKSLMSKEIQDKLKNESSDDFFAEKQFLHFTYPFEQTMERLQVIFETIGDEQWQAIFGFKFELFLSFIGTIIVRTILFNDYVISKDENFRHDYENAFPFSKNCFMTREEFIYFFQDETESLDKILNLVSKNINDLTKQDEVSLILRYKDYYYLYFIWDFLYYIYDILEKNILNYYSTHKLDKELYRCKKGKAFENICFQQIKTTFNKDNIFKNIMYDFNGGNHEIDILVETPKEYIVFECKSSNFDIHKTKNNREMKEAFIRAFGNGFKTINDFHNFIKNGNGKMYYKGKSQKYEFNFQLKKVIFINVSLYNIEYLQTGVQKIDKTLIQPVDIYPINWNFIDFLTIMKLAQYNFELFEKYLYERFDMINNNKNLTLDIDEIDAFGFLTDDNNKKIWEFLKEKDNSTVDMNFMINNGIYREEINNQFNKDFYDELFNTDEKFLPIE